MSKSRLESDHEYYRADCKLEPSSSAKLYGFNFFDDLTAAPPDKNKPTFMQLLPFASEASRLLRVFNIPRSTDVSIFNELCLVSTPSGDMKTISNV